MGAVSLDMISEISFLPVLSCDGDEKGTRKGEKKDSTSGILEKSRFHISVKTSVSKLD